MLKQITNKIVEDFEKVQLNAIIDAAIEIYELNQNKPVKILDLATGPNQFNPKIVKNLINKGIDYELTLSDISPIHFKIGYENLEKELSSEELKKIKCVLADSRDLRKELTLIHLWGESKKPLEEVLSDPIYQFLQTGYNDGQRIVDFSDESFDLIIGCIPYGSINTGDYSDAIKESARVLKRGGYHIVNESHVEKIQSYGLRAKYTLDEMKKKSFKGKIETLVGSLFGVYRALQKNLPTVYSKLNNVLKPVNMECDNSFIYTFYTDERIPEQTVQNGDVIKNTVFVHKKVN